MKNYESIENKYQELIDIAIKYMKQIKDPEHNIIHMNDVVLYTKKLLDVIKIDVNPEVCIISAYWHDVGRLYQSDGHEKLSADMLKEEMIKRNYSSDLINACYQAIINHKWNMTPTTNEGLIIKDADKLDFIGINRWSNCLKNNKDLTSIIKLLPDLKNNILYFEESKEIYDQEIIKLTNYLYNIVKEN